MTTLTIVRGISGSGKSTWAADNAEALKALIVSRDAIRMAQFNTEAFIDEEAITLAEHGMIRAYLSAGRNVISDNTSIEPKYVNAMVKIAREVGAEVELKVFDVDLLTALQRNDKRALLGGRFVPHDVIKKQHRRFERTKHLTIEPLWTPKPYYGTPGKPDAFLLDVDGTIAHNKNTRGFYDWKRVGDDDVDQVVAKVVNSVREGGMDCIVMSGRDAVCRPETEAWFEKHFIIYDAMFMRPEKDQRKDSIVKAELFDTYVRDNYNVKLVFDDRWQVIRDCWLPMGIKVFNVSGLDRGEF